MSDEETGTVGLPADEMLARLNGALDRIEAALAALAERSPAGPDPRLAQLELSFVALEEKAAQTAREVAELGRLAEPAAGDWRVELAALQATIARLADAVQGQASGGDGELVALVSSLQGRLEVPDTAAERVLQQMELLGATASDIRMRLDRMEGLADGLATLEALPATLSEHTQQLAEAVRHAVVDGALKQSSRIDQLDEALVGWTEDVELAVATGTQAAQMAASSATEAIQASIAQAALEANARDDTAAMARVADAVETADAIRRGIEEMAAAGLNRPADEPTRALRAELVGTRLALRAAVREVTTEIAEEVSRRVAQRDGALADAISDELTRQFSLLAQAGDEVAAEARVMDDHSRRQVLDNLDAQRAAVASLTERLASALVEREVALPTQIEQRVDAAVQYQMELQLHDWLTSQLSVKLAEQLAALDGRQAVLEEGLQAIQGRLDGLGGSSDSEEAAAQVAAKVGEIVPAAMASSLAQLVQSNRDQFDRLQANAVETIRRDLISLAQAIKAATDAGVRAAADEGMQRGASTQTAAIDLAEVSAAIETTLGAAADAALARITGTSEATAAAVDSAIARLGPVNEQASAARDAAVEAALAKITAASEASAAAVDGAIARLAAAKEQVQAAVAPPAPLDADLDLLGQRIEALADIVQRSLEVRDDLTRDRVAADVTERLSRLREAAAGVSDAVKAEAQRRRGRRPGN